MYTTYILLESQFTWECKIISQSFTVHQRKNKFKHDNTLMKLDIILDKHIRASILMSLIRVERNYGNFRMQNIVIKLSIYNNPILTEKFVGYFTKVCYKIMYHLWKSLSYLTTAFYIQFSIMSKQKTNTPRYRCRQQWKVGYNVSLNLECFSN